MANDEPLDSPLGAGEPEGSPGDAGWLASHASRWIERAQDVLSAAVAAVLVALAAAILVAGAVDFVTGTRQVGLEGAATDFVDKVLLVLILVEIVHTVVLSLRAHALAAQPFVVVGLVAVIRKILLSLASPQPTAASTLGLYVAMVAVFVGALVAIEVFGGRRTASARRGAPSQVVERSRGDSARRSGHQEGRQQGDQP